VACLSQSDGSRFGDVTHVHAVHAYAARRLRIDARADGIQHGKIVLVEIVGPQDRVLRATCPDDALNRKLRDEVGNRQRLVSLMHAQINDALDACCDRRIDGVDPLSSLVAVERRNQE
jgi:hypothetical protein